ncbi:uncharacterized protein [Choristoneura fumiferana]|uniref:uncharacterized protein n=1 Tax=Choristoneura fumiferana TaxID=7141 RepID=UPI003D155839
MQLEPKKRTCLVNNMEELSSEILEKDLIKMFRPVHTLQSWLGFQRVKIKHRFVTAPSVYYQFYSSTIWLLSIIATADFVFYCETNLQALTSVVFLKYGFLVNVLINAVSAWRNNFHNGNLNSQLYVKLQKIDRIFKMKGAATSNQKMYSYSLTITVIFVILWFSCILILNDIAMKSLCPSVLFLQIMGVGSYMEIILVSLMLKFLSLRLDHMNTILEKATKHFKNKLQAVKMSFFTKEFDQEKTKDYNELALGMHGILDALNDIIKLFQFPILSFTCQVMIWDFTLMQNVVTAIKEKVCLHKMHMRARQILMLVEIKSTFAIYDVYTVDNRLPLHIFAISATYTIVLLQIANL